MDREAARRVIESSLTQPFAEDRFRLLAVNLLDGINEEKGFEWVAGQYIKDAFKDHVRKYRRLGTYTDPDGRTVDVLVVHLKNPWALERSRTTQRNFVAEYLKQRGEKDAALIAYCVDDPTNWRFSFVRMQYREEVTEAGRVKVKEEFTPSRRYSFLVGQDEPSHTAQQQLVPLLEQAQTPTLDEIERTFSVERVTKEFYTDYRGLFEKGCEALDAIAAKDKRVRDEFARQSIDPANFAKKLLGQIVFLYFLQKKGWLGVGRDETGDFLPWGQGPKDFLRGLYEKRFGGYKSFFDEILEPLFYEALATERPDDVYTRFNCRIPFLNGGLFEPLNDYNWREVDIHVPNVLLGEVLDTFDRYNFTVREDDPLDQEVAVDPEMLGKVFENLLPENLRKGKGSYYTPRNVVHFMCQESLISYLDGAINREAVSLGPTHKEQHLVASGEAEEIALGGGGCLVPRGDLEEFIRRGEFSLEMDAAKVGGTKSYKYRLPETIRKHARLLDAALSEIKVCDPAVGSGAFLVGMMHEVVKSRTILATYSAGSPTPSLYELKRRCIQDSLYGVDIDPGAVDIAKLRLWLSLVVDEDEYKSIHPLPNLDYKVMQGNSLFEDFHGISLLPDREDGSGTLLRRDKGLTALIEKLHKTQGAYFGANHPGEKKKLRADVEDLILEVFSYAVARQDRDYQEEKAQIERKASGFPKAARDSYIANELRRLQARFRKIPAELQTELRELTHGNVPRDFFPWRLYFADAFQRGGFDVVIANPPYVRQERITDQKPRLREAYPDVYHGVADIYVYFYRRAFDIAGPGGIVTFISSNKYFRAGYGKTLRQYLRDETELRLVIDFGDLPVFDATTYPCVVLANRTVVHPKHSSVRVASVRSLGVLDALPDHVAREGWDQPQEQLLNEGWVLERRDARLLVEKLRMAGTPFGEYVQGPFYRGIVTGCNEAFVIDAATRDRLIGEDSRSAEIIKPWLRGKDVKRWQVEWREQYLLWTYKGIAIRDYPAVSEYLSQFRDQLAKRWEPSRGQCRWYELRPCDYYAEFERPKIIYPDIAKRCEFALDTGGFYGGNTLYFVPQSDLSLLAMLNSRVTEFFYMQISAMIQQDYLRFFSQYLAQIPIPKLNVSQRGAIERLVRRLLKAEGEGSQVAEWEQELDATIYYLYGLTADEIRIIEDGRAA